MYNIVTLVSPDIAPDAASVRQVEAKTACRIQQVSTFKDLFNLISDVNRALDCVIVCVEEIANQAKLSIIEMVNAVRTVISVSGRDIKLAIAIHPEIPTDIIKQVQRTGYDYFYPGGRTYSVDDKATTIQYIKTGQRYTAPVLEPLIKPKAKIRRANVDLTPRQHQIMEIVSKRGASNKVIARMLNISESTVKLHMSGILKKFGVRNRTQLALFARDHA